MRLRRPASRRLPAPRTSRDPSIRARDWFERLCDGIARAASPNPFSSRMTRVFADLELKRR